MWTLIGYFPKLRVTRNGWQSPYPEYPQAEFPAPLPVQEICSVSNCIARGLESSGVDPIWNPFGGFHEPELARTMAAVEGWEDFQVLAYRLAPILYRDGAVEEIAMPDVKATSFGESFERLGFDAVQTTGQTGFGCSPLSCNGQTDKVRLNRYCLVDTAEEAAELARRFSISKPEPDPYGIVEVWRERGEPEG